MKYSLKSIAVGFEIAFFDNEDETGLSELKESLQEAELGYFDVLKKDLEILELPNKNLILLFTLVIRIDNDIITKSDLSIELEKLRQRTSDALSKFLKSRNLIYVEYKNQ
jgi:hypothetical protein